MPRTTHPRVTDRLCLSGPTASRPQKGLQVLPPQRGQEKREEGPGVSSSRQVCSDGPSPGGPLNRVPAALLPALPQDPGARWAGFCAPCLPSPDRQGILVRSGLQTPGRTGFLLGPSPAVGPGSAVGPVGVWLLGTRCPELAVLNWIWGQGLVREAQRGRVRSRRRDRDSPAEPSGSRWELDHWSPPSHDTNVWGAVA